MAGQSLSVALTLAAPRSAGGIGWQPNLSRYLPLFETQGYAAARTWLEANPDVWEWSGYAASKQAIALGLAACQ